MEGDDRTRKWQDVQEIRIATAVISILLLVIALLLAAIVFGFAEIKVTPA